MKAVEAEIFESTKQTHLNALDRDVNQAIQD